MRRIVAIVLMLGMLGCGTDPEIGRFEAGDEAIIFHEKYDQVWLDGVPSIDIPPDEAVVAPSVGTKVTIVSDDEEPGKLSEYRKVRVNVKEGEFAGIVGTVSRSNLRPVMR